MARSHFEAWTLPTDDTFRKIIDVPVLAGTSGSRELSNYSDNTAMVRADWAGRDQVGSALMRRFVGTKVTDEWIVRRIDKAIQRPGTYELSGPQINGVVEGLTIYPRTKHADVQDWIWGGDNVLPDLSLSALGNISATYELVLMGERYELDVSLATTGTYILSYAGNDTSPIDFDATHSDIKSAVEALPGITTVSVLQPDPDTREFILVIENPKDLPSNITADFTGTGGLGNLTKLNDGFDTGASPTFTITVDGATTEPLPWNISDNGLEGTATGGTGLQGLATVSDVTVEGSGTAADPRVITFYDPPSPGSVTVTFAAGTAILERTQAGALDPGQITQSKPVDQGTGPAEVHGSYDNPPLEVDTTVTNTGADYSIKVNVAGRYGGSQIVVNVTPGQTYQVSIPIRKTVTGLHTLVVHDIAQNPIAQTSPRDNLLAADGSFHDLEIVDVEIPLGTTQVIMREANTDPSASTWAPHYADWQNARFIEGMPPSTFTKIVRTLVEDGQARGSFEFLDRDFTDTHDSAGNELEPESFTAFAFSNLDNVLSDGDAVGYKWRVVAKDTPAGGKTHDLQIFYGGEAEDLTASTGGPTVQAGAVRDASVVSRTPEFTVAVGWGSEGIYVEVEDAALVAEYGRIEKVFDAEHLTSEESLTRLLEEKFREQAINADALSAEVDDNAQQVPLVDYAEGSKIWWAFPDQDVPKVAKVVERVSWVEGLASSTYTLNGSEELSEYGALARAVDHLLRQFRIRRRNRQKTTPTVQGGGGQVGAHIHLERSATQSIGSGGEAISWDTEYASIVKQNFAWSAGAGITIQEPGYYDVHVGAKWAAAHDSPEVWVTRTRDGVELTVWPPSTLDSWTAPYRAQLFEGTAPAIPCRSGDVLKVYVDHGEVSAQNLAEAALTVELVDRVPPSQEPGYRELVLSHKPIAYWRLGETNPLAHPFDETGHGHEGTFSSPPPTLGVDGLINDPDTAMTFADDFIGITTDNINQWEVSELSVEAWIKTSETVDSQMILSRDHATSGNRVFFFRVNAGKVEFVLPSGLKVTGTVDVADGATHYVAATYDGTTCRVYVDGELNNSGTLNEALATGTIGAVAIARRYGITEAWFEGTLDEVAAYGRVLTAAEIASHYQVGRSG